MSLKAHATQTFDEQKIPAAKQAVMWRSVVQGVAVALVGLALVAVAVKVVLATNDITKTALTLVVVGLAIFGMGCHMASSQVTTAAGKWLVSVVKDMYAAVRGKNGSS